MMTTNEHLSTPNDDSTPIPSVLDDGSLKEPVDTILPKDKIPEECPDGGLRAWLVVFGVRRGYLVDGTHGDLVWCAGGLRDVRDTRSHQHVGSKSDLEFVNYSDTD